MVEGLKLTISGDDLRTLLEHRIHRHQLRAERWRHEQARTPEEQTEDEPLLPEHICENEAERHDWRANVLAFLRDHIDATEVYRLGAADLTLGELLPEKPGWLEQDDYEERNRLAFNLERLAKRSPEFVGVRMDDGMSEVLPTASHDTDESALT